MNESVVPIESDVHERYSRSTSVLSPHVVSACSHSTDIKAGPELVDSLLPSTLSSIANLSSCMKDGKDEDGGKSAHSVLRCDNTEPLWWCVQHNPYTLCVCVGIELDKLDAEMIKTLAWQRIQQLFPPKKPSTPPPPVTSAAPKTPSPHPDSKTRASVTQLFSLFHITSHFLQIRVLFFTLKMNLNGISLFDLEFFFLKIFLYFKS